LRTSDALAPGRRAEDGAGGEDAVAVAKGLDGDGSSSTALLE